MRCFFVILLLGVSLPLQAQWADDFADGDFTAHPEWTGSTTGWSVVPYGSRLWLSTAGAARADTIYLATRSDIAFGKWMFRFMHRDVNLSNFNGARIFLTADTSDLRGPARGYYLQFGTNNSNEVRLFRMDGDPANRRVEIGRYSEPVLAGTSNEFVVTVERDAGSRWTVSLDGRVVIDAVDATYTSSKYFGVWVKHTAAAAESYFFTDFGAHPGESPPKNPPAVLVDVLHAEQLSASFSREMSADVCKPERYVIWPHGHVREAHCTSERDVTIVLDTRLDVGKHALHIHDVYDGAGDRWDVLSAEFEITPADTATFRVERVSYAWRAPSDLTIHLANRIDPTRYHAADIVLPGYLVQDRLLSSDNHALTVRVDRSLADGQIELGLRSLVDERGRRVDTLLHVTIPARPSRGDLVINEIHYDPPDQAWEFFELFNRSERSFDLSWFDWSDDRLLPTPLSAGPVIIEPRGYAVFVRSAQAFSEEFAGTDLTEPPHWHVLNNSGDAVIVYAGDMVVDSVAYVSNWGGRHVSLERVDPDAPSVRANFASSLDAAGATPGRENSVFFQDPTRGRIEYAHQSSSHRVELVADRNLSAEGNTQVSCPGATIEHVAVQEHRVLVDLVMGRPSTCSGDGFVDALGRPIDPFDIQVALLPAVGDLLINEFMFDPLTDPYDSRPDQPFYLEIVSTASFPLSLDAVHLSGPVTETGTFSVMSHDRSLTSLDPGGFAVFSAEGTLQGDSPGTSMLASAFPDFQHIKGSSELLPVRRATLGTPRSGGHVRLLRSDSLVLDELTYRPTMHHPALRETRGRSLERRAVGGQSSDPQNWASSHGTDGGTPGRANSVARVDAAPADMAGISVEPRVFSPEAQDSHDHTRIHYNLQLDASTVRARVYDSRGRLVRTIEHGHFTGPRGYVVWDGHDDQRRPQRAGIYIVLLDAVDLQNGASVRYRDTVVLGRHLGR